MSPSPPLRFLVLLLAGWGGMRAAWLAPGWWTSPAAGRGGPSRGEGAAAPRAALVRPGAAPVRRPFHARPARLVQAAVAPQPAVRRDDLPAPAGPARPAVADLAWTLAPAAGRRPAARPPPAGARRTRSAAVSRWSLAAWSFLREGDSPPLAAGGLLGGSQAGARLAYRVGGDPARPLALAARLTSPIRRPAGAEAAFGLDWQPSRRLPLHLLVERRQRLGRDGRSAFGLTVYGGFGDAPLGRLRIDAYAQAGMVGARSRDLFGDGALRLSLPLGGRARLGAGAWAAAQPGVARLDLGPQVSLRLPVAGRNATIAADWRFRVAGNARPGSGPALTVATDF